MFYWFNGGFYVDSVHIIPDGAVPVTPERHAELLAGQAAGKIIATDADGRPILVDPPAPTAEEIYNQKINDLMKSAEDVARSIKVPYSPEEAQTWWCQYHEAEEWTSSSAYVPVMLNAMVSASAGGWTRAGLAASILINAAEWKAAAGNILGQRKAKLDALKSLLDSVVAETATLADLQAFDTSINPPTVNLEDKF